MKTVENLETKDRLYFRRELAAEYLNISIRTLDQLKADGELPFCKIGGIVIFIKQDMDAFILGNRIAVGE